MIRFGTGGWRAIIADGFTRANLQKLCRGLALLMHQEGVAGRGVIVGYDRRFLSREAALWAIEVLTAHQVVCRLIEPDAPTPLVMFTVRQTKTAYGLSVTASHNPAVYNGIKLFTAGGRDADEGVTGQLEALIDGLGDEPIPVMPLARAEEEGLLLRINPFNAYIDAIIDSVDMDAIRGRGLKVALDPMYGVSKTSLQTILLTARCHVEVIHERHDTLFGGRLPSPKVDTLNTLKQLVVERSFDLGIATDGDADRLGIIDDRGVFLHPNQILVLLYDYLVNSKGWTGPCVRNLATTHLLDRMADAFGQTCYEVPVGFKHVSAKMQETGAVIGGESSGGLTVRGHIPGKDGIYAATLLVEMLAVTGRSLSELLLDIRMRFGAFHLAEQDYRYPAQRRHTLNRQLAAGGNLPDFGQPPARVGREDGCKVTFENGDWVLARFSGTEDLLRLTAETSEPSRSQQLIRLWADQLALGS